LFLLTETKPPNSPPKQRNCGAVYNITETVPVVVSPVT